MSGTLACLCLDGRPVAKAHMESMLQAGRRRGPDGAHEWSDGAVALGHLAFDTTPEPGFQPYSHPGAGIAVSLDGRVDNRTELLGELEKQDPELRSDAELLTAAYQRWGLGCVERIIGDFAFALWDARRRRLLLARDALGVRPLYYALSDRLFLAASGTRELLSIPDVSRAVNEGMVGEYLTGNVHSKSETLYTAIRRLPPGHLMVVEAGGARIEKYWNPEQIDELVLPPGEYEERFNELVREAVRCRARSPGPIAADLSGGLDSSSVVAVLGSLKAKGELDVFEAFSLAFGSRPCDETEYARAVAERTGCAWNLVSVEPLPEVDFLQLARDVLDVPAYPNGMMSSKALDLARQKGMRVVLTGVGGDEWLGAAPKLARCYDWAKTGDLAGLREELAGADYGHLLFASAWHALGLGFRALHIDNPLRSLKVHRFPPWIRVDFARRIDLVERVSTPALAPWDDWSRRLRLARGTAGWPVHAMETQGAVDAGRQVELRHPFLDRRLVEFLLAVPERLCKSANGDKLLLRRAMRQALPKSVLERRTKAEFSHVFRHSLGTLSAQNMLQKGTVARPEWVDASRARAAHEAYLRGEQPSWMWPLWALYGIQLWHRVVYGTNS